MAATGGLMAGTQIFRADESAMLLAQLICSKDDPQERFYSRNADIPLFRALAVDLDPRCVRLLAL
jgi:hypothetical protein